MDTNPVAKESAGAEEEAPTPQATGGVTPIRMRQAEGDGSKDAAKAGCAILGLENSTTGDRHLTEDLRESRISKDLGWEV